MLYGFIEYLYPVFSWSLVHCYWDYQSKWILVSLFLPSKDPSSSSPIPQHCLAVDSLRETFPLQMQKVSPQGQSSIETCLSWKSHYQTQAWNSLSQLKCFSSLPPLLFLLLLFPLLLSPGAVIRPCYPPHCFHWPSGCNWDTV